MVVLPDADIDMAADAAVSAGYGSSGERCMAISRSWSPSATSADPLVEAIEQRLPKIKVGPGHRPDRRDGAARHPGAPRQGGVATWTAAAAQGATVVTDGREHPLYATRDGFFLGVSLHRRRDAGHGRVPRRDLRPGARRSSGSPPTTRPSALVNDNPYGNGTAIFTRDGGAARQFQFDVKVGMVGINVPIPVPVAYYSFGGWKASLFGDLHMYGPEGIQFYTRSKVVTSRWPDPGTSKVDLGFPRTR